MKRAFCAAAVLVGALALGACGDDNDEPESTTTPATSTGGTTTTATTEATQPAGSPSAPAGDSGFDASFGEDGILAVNLSGSENDRFMAVALDDNGNIFAAGYVSQSGDHAMALAKFDPDGAPDTSFGTDGVAIVNVATGGGTAELARAVAIQSSGNIIIGGPIEQDTSAGGDAARDTDFAVVRFDPTGAVDMTFGEEGIARFDLGPGKAVSETSFVGDTSWGLGSLPGDSIVVFGSTLSQGGADRTDADFFLAGLTSEGQLDPAFGDAGTLILDRPEGDSPRNVTVTDDGMIIATGYSRTAEGTVAPVIIRASATGELDESFGEGGIASAAVLPGVAESYAIGLQGDNYVAAGYGRGADSGEKVDMIIYRFTADGEWDQSFGTEGVTRIDLAGEDDRARNVTVLPDGRILAVGSGKLNADEIDGLVVLLDEDGAPVTSFVDEGHVLTDLGGASDAWYGVAATADGAAIVAGYKGVSATSGGNDDAVIGRLTF